MCITIYPVFFISFHGMIVIVLKLICVLNALDSVSGICVRVFWFQIYISCFYSTFVRQNFLFDIKILLLTFKNFQY